MSYLLDTNAVIALMKNHPQVVGRIRQVGRSELVVCAPVEAELWFGVCKSSRTEENRRHLLILLEWLPSPALYPQLFHPELTTPSLYPLHRICRYL